MIVDCVSDFHGEYPKLEGGDLLILAGDYTASGKIKEWCDFFHWLKEQKYEKKILVAGNHDNLFESAFPKNEEEAFELREIMDFLDFEEDFEYLCDSGTEYKGFKIWGSPWTLKFPEVNPHCTSFMDSEAYISNRFAMIPDDIDILITHSPPNGILDNVTSKDEWCGSRTLRNRVFFVQPKLHIFGHIHEWGGKIFETSLTKFVNASLMNEDYEFVNKPVRITL